MRRNPTLLMEVAVHCHANGKIVASTVIGYLHGTVDRSPFQHSPRPAPVSSDHNDRRVRNHRIPADVFSTANVRTFDLLIDHEFRRLRTPPP